MRRQRPEEVKLTYPERVGETKTIRCMPVGLPFLLLWNDRPPWMESIKATEADARLVYEYALQKKDTGPAVLRRLPRGVVPGHASL